MTDIKPESDQSLVTTILEQGLKAAQQQNWLEVSNQLKQLPQSKSDYHSNQFLVNSADWQTVFDVALEMLIKADFQHKWEITKLFPLLGDKIIIPLSALALDETVEAEVRWFICQILGNFAEQSVVLTLVQLLQQSTDHELITIAGKTLVKIGDRAIDALVELLSQPKYRLLATKALSYIRTVSTITPLLAITTYEDAELRAIAINALGSFHDRRVPPVLITALQDPASTVRKEAAIALGFRPDLCQEINLVEHLQPLLYDLNLEVCSQAAISLGRMQQPTANAVLFEVLQANTTPMSLKLDLVKALGWSQLSSGIVYLEQALSNPSELIVQEIILVLGRISTPELKHQSVQVLINLWQLRQSLPVSSRQTLATSLGELRDRSAIPVLQELAQDSDRKVQLHVLAALKKLAINNEQ
ncbi:MAG: HEAT repeat domain-containing protein [Hyellaceae cyanobacterium CSU_1_1]|nr:HEAT repeat domain-containing protein [Pleurocapsa sp. CRU_1_2]NJR44485.1 HEAT repeat domain-containing protein [Hyellaceae cyanobacterium CSU_1_1]